MCGQRFALRSDHLKWSSCRWAERSDADPLWCGSVSVRPSMWALLVRLPRLDVSLVQNVTNSLKGRVRKHRYRPTRTSDVWVRPKRDKSVKSSPHCRTTEGQPVARVGTGSDVRLGCLRGQAGRAQCDSLNTRLRGWRARGFQAAIDVRHGCGVTAASVDLRDCQVGAVNDNLRVALDVQLQRTTGRDGALRPSCKVWPSQRPRHGASHRPCARAERARSCCLPPASTAVAANLPCTGSPQTGAMSYLTRVNRK